MKRLSFLLLSGLLLLPMISHGQQGKDFNAFTRIYPIGEDPSISVKTSYVAQETILFEATPIARYSIYNNMLRGLATNNPHMQAWYIAARPQLRMYLEESLPVKTPSYQIAFGTQHLYRRQHDTFLAFSIESGHYSNGQPNCAFSEDFVDGSPECEELYQQITPETNLSDLLNRRSGNFSTNFTELILRLSFNELDDDFVAKRVHSIQLGTTYYHDRLLFLFEAGGFSDQDIELYGRFRHLLAYEYVHTYAGGSRLALSENMELIQGAHAQVNPLRSASTVTYFPFPKMKEVGFFASYIYGHDNYNFRFVDAGHQLAAGVKWSSFPPVHLKSSSFFEEE